MQRVGRRAVLGGALALATTGCGRWVSPALREEPPVDAACRTPGELTTFGALGGALIRYEVTHRATTMRAEPGFLRQLEAWALEWSKHSGLGPLKVVSSFGAYTDKCASWHQVGRAFDIGSLVHARGEVTCRFDQWGPGTDRQRRLYWRLAASLHQRFAYTICYPYNAEHLNHIHVDNSVNGTGFTTFDPESQVQVQLVQNVCRHVFGLDAPTTSAWDDQTRDALRRVQRRSGITAPLREPEGWQAFLRASVRG